MPEPIAPVLEVRGLRKRFAGQRSLFDVIRRRPQSSAASHLNHDDHETYRISFSNFRKRFANDALIYACCNASRGSTASGG